MRATPFSATALRSGQLCGGPLCTRRLFTGVSAARRRALRQHAGRLLDATQAFVAAGSSVAAAMVGGREYHEWAHYPPEDACSATGLRVYYHAHAAAQRLPGEHGHFHVFMENGTAPGDFSHLIGLSLDAHGLPLRVFTTNQWVTAETWVPAAVVCRHLARACFDGMQLAAVGDWLHAALGLFMPQICQCVQLRDARVAALYAQGQAGVLADRRRPVLSQCRIDLARQIQALDALDA